jgi:hypothetical protein
MVMDVTAGTQERAECGGQHGPGAGAGALGCREPAGCPECTAARQVVADIEPHQVSTTCRELALFRNVSYLLKKHQVIVGNQR